MRMAPIFVAMLSTVWGSACKQENPYDPKHQASRKGPPVTPKVVGVDPEKFDCVKFVSLEEVSKLAGGDEVISEATGVPVPPGTPAPCTYIAIHKLTEAEQKQLKIEEEKRMKKAESGKDTTIADEVAAWGKSLDRVFGMRFDCRSTSHQAHLDWMKQLKSNVDAKAKDVQIGKGGVDHIGGELVFLDDDTPCAVTITGPDESLRLALAEIVKGRLVLENAPMTPRAVQ
jgi:hypothetical protein